MRWSWRWLSLCGMFVLCSVWIVLPWITRKDVVITTDANNAVFSPTQAVLAIATNDGIRLWRTAEPQLQVLTGTRTIDGALNPLRLLLAWSTDGRYLATNGDVEGNTIEIWDTVTQTRVNVLQESAQAHAKSLAFSPDGTLLVIAAYNELQLWHWREQNEQILDLGRYTRAVFSADGQYIVTPSEIWRVSDKTRTLRGYELGGQLGVGTGNCAATSPVKMVAALCSYDGKIALIDLTTMQLMRQFQAYEGGITAVAFSPDGRWLAVGPGSYESIGVETYDIRIWSVADGQLVYTLKSPTLGATQSLSFSMDGKQLVALTQNQLFGVKRKGQDVHIWAIH